MSIKIKKRKLGILTLIFLLTVSIAFNIFLYMNNSKNQASNESKVEQLEEQIEKLEQDIQVSESNLLEPLILDYEKEQEAKVKEQYLNCVSDMLNDNPTSDADMIEMYRTLCSDITGFEN
jgi:TolA-binding protein